MIKEESREITPTEAIVVREVMRGLKNKDIAKKLYLSSHTVKFHLQNLYNKTQTHSRTALCSKIMFEIFGNKLTAEMILEKFGKNKK